jgi:hypothetical protein
MPRTARLTRLAVLALLCCAASAAEPPQPETAPRAVRVSVVTIFATTKDDKIDPRLVDVAREVQTNIDPQLKGFRVQCMDCKSLRPGAGHDFKVGCDQVVAVTILQGPDKLDRVQLTVKPPLLGEVTYTAACGAFLPIITRCRNKNGDLLIIAVRVAPCNGGK